MTVEWIEVKDTEKVKKNLDKLKSEHEIVWIAICHMEKNPLGKLTGIEEVWNKMKRKPKAKEYYQRPEVKEKRRKYMREVRKKMEGNK